jgi:hypothetical protein
VTEEYSVSVDGLRQDFIITELPKGDGPLRLDLALSGARAESAEYGARITLDGSGRRLAYSRLKAWDAAGRELTAHMTASNFDRLTVVVEDAGAVWPLRIEPTFSDDNWTSMGALMAWSMPWHSTALATSMRGGGSPPREAKVRVILQKPR